MYLFLDYLEVLLGSLLICVFCDIEDKKRFCLITSIINFFIIQFFHLQLKTESFHYAVLTKI